MKALTLILLATLASLPGSLAANADPTSCDCLGETFKIGSILKSEHEGPGEGQFFGYRVKILDFLCGDGLSDSCSTTGGQPELKRSTGPREAGEVSQCLAKVVTLGHYQEDYSGSKVNRGKRKPKSGPKMPEILNSLNDREHAYPLFVCQRRVYPSYSRYSQARVEIPYRLDTAYEARLAAEQAGPNQGAVGGGQAAPIGARPRPEDDSAAPQVDANAPRDRAATAIAVDPQTGDPIVDPNEPLNAELDRQLRAEGWNPAVLTNGFRPGRIVSARRDLKLPLAKGKGKVSLEEGQLGQIVSTGFSGPIQAGGKPQVFVLWRKKKSNTLLFLRDIGLALARGGIIGTAFYTVSGLMGGWQSYGDIKLVLAPADAADLRLER